MVRRLFLVLVVVVVLVSGCTSPPPEDKAVETVGEGGINVDAPPEAHFPEPPALEAFRVSITDSGFDPAVVNMSPGGVVEWVNIGNMAHTVSSIEMGFDSGELKPGERWSHTFQEEGDYDYRCSLHPSETGEVKVSRV